MEWPRWSWESCWQGPPSDALAAGSSDISSDGNHCYLFFEFPDETFAQAMVNDSNPNVVVEKLTEFLDKYVTVGGKTGGCDRQR